MKKWIVLFLAALLLAALAMPALAGSEPNMTITAGQGTVYIGQNNDLYELGVAEPLCLTAAGDLVYADATKVLFVALDDNQLMEIALNNGDATPKAIATTVCGGIFVPRDNTVYYIDQNDDSNLMGYDPVSGTSSARAGLAHEVGSMFASVDGLVMEAAGGNLLFVPATGEFVNASATEVGAVIADGGTFETIHQADGSLSIRTIGQPLDQATPVDSSVTAVTTLHNMVYYLKTNADSTFLMKYDYTMQASVQLVQFQTALFPRLSAAGDSVYAIGNDGRIFALNVDSHALSTYGEVENVPTDVVFAATGAMVVVYDASAETHFPKFLKAVAPANTDVSDVIPVVEPANPEDEVQPENTPEPPAAQNMTRGSRGEDVKTLQEILHASGYPTGKPDGIFGAGTALAVKYLQSDWGLNQTGVVTPEFFDRIKNEELPTFVRYIELKKGSRGIRVSLLQERLRALRYMDGKADGIYGSATVKGVELFEKTMNDKQNGVATVKVQEQLFSKNAPNASTIYDDIEPKPTKKPSPENQQNPQISEDDLITMVRWLNDKFPGENLNKKNAIYKVQSRLADLGYMKKSHRTKIYDTNTFKAMKHFQNDYNPDAKATGIPNTHTMELLFPARLF